MTTTLTTSRDDQIFLGLPLSRLERLESSLELTGQRLAALRKLPRNKDNRALILQCELDELYLLQRVLWVPYIPNEGAPAKGRWHTLPVWRIHVRLHRRLVERKKHTARFYKAQNCKKDTRR